MSWSSTFSSSFSSSNPTSITSLTQHPLQVQFHPFHLGVFSLHRSVPAFLALCATTAILPGASRCAPEPGFHHLDFQPADLLNLILSQQPSPNLQQQKLPLPYYIRCLNTASSLAPEHIIETVDVRDVPHLVHGIDGRQRDLDRIQLLLVDGHAGQTTTNTVAT